MEEHMAAVSKVGVETMASSSADAAIHAITQARVQQIQVKFSGAQKDCFALYDPRQRCDSKEAKRNDSSFDDVRNYTNGKLGEVEQAWLVAQQTHQAVANKLAAMEQHREDYRITGKDFQFGIERGRLERLQELTKVFEEEVIADEALEAAEQTFDRYKGRYRELNTVMQDCIEKLGNDPIEHPDCSKIEEEVRGLHSAFGLEKSEQRDKARDAIANIRGLLSERGDRLGDYNICHLSVMEVEVEISHSPAKSKIHKMCGDADATEHIIDLLVAHPDLHYEGLTTEELGDLRMLKKRLKALEILLDSKSKHLDATKSRLQQVLVASGILKAAGIIERNLGQNYQNFTCVDVCEDIYDQCLQHIKSYLDLADDALSVG